MKKSLLLSLILLLFCFNILKSKAQTPQWEWSKSYGNSGNDRAEKIAVDSRNGVYSYGTFTSTTLNIGNNTFTNNGGPDLFLIKHDTLGNVQWAKTFGGAGVDTAGSICTDRMGNIIITGSFSNTISIDSYTFTSTGQKNIFIAKLNNAGNIIWAQQFSCSGDATATDIKTDIVNSIYIVGNYKNGDLLFGNIPLAASNTNNLFYSKLRDDGTVIWAKRSVAML